MTGSAPAPRPGRVHAIDLLRLLMSLQMIQGHTIASLLDPEARHGALYEAWTFARGLTAVGFLVAAGASYHLVIGRESDAASVARGRSRRVRRALLLIAVGFCLRPPVGIFSGVPEQISAALDAFFAVDVLQCIGVTLLGLEALRRFVPKPRMPAVAALLALVFVALAPFTASLEAEPPTRWLLDWVSRRGGSLFPLFPWSGFVLTGVALGAFVERSRDLRGALTLLGAGLFIALLGEGLSRIVPAVPPDDYYAWPPFSLIRVGLVLVLLALLALGSLRLTRLPEVLTTLAGQTLVLYVVHLVALHGAGVGLLALVGPTLSPAAAVLVALVLIAVSVGAALAWAGLAWAARPMDRAASDR